MACTFWPNTPCRPSSLSPLPLLYQHPFLDLDALHDPTQKKKVTALYVSAQARTPDQPGAEPHLRRRQRDARLTAWERAQELYNKANDEWQQALDEEHFQVYQYATECVCAIFNDPAHYIHDKAKRSQVPQSSTRSVWCKSAMSHPLKKVTTGPSTAVAINVRIAAHASIKD